VPHVYGLPQIRKKGDASTSSIDVELFRLLLEHGFDLNEDVYQYAPNDERGGSSHITRMAFERDCCDNALMKVALEPQYNAIVDKCDGENGTALSQAAVHGKLEMMDLLLAAGASASFVWPSQKGQRYSLVLFVTAKLIYSNFEEKNAAIKDGSIVEALAKLLHKGKPDTALVEEALDKSKQVRKSDVSPGGRVAIQFLENYLAGQPYCCDFCGTTKREDGDKAKYLQTCTCESVAYCGSACQRSAWRAHRGACGGVPDGGGTAAEVGGQKKSADEKGNKGRKGRKKGKRG